MRKNFPVHQDTIQSKHSNGYSIDPTLRDQIILLKLSPKNIHYNLRNQGIKNTHVSLLLLQILVINRHTKEPLSIKNEVLYT